jgi:hypothetical protein
MITGNFFTLSTKFTKITILFVIKVYPCPKGPTISLYTHDLQDRRPWHGYNYLGFYPSKQTVELLHFPALAFRVAFGLASSWPRKERPSQPQLLRLFLDRLQ